MTIREINRLSTPLNCSPITAPPKIAQAKLLGSFDVRESISSFMSTTARSENTLNLVSDRSDRRGGLPLAEKQISNRLKKENIQNTTLSNISDIRIRTSPSPGNPSNYQSNKFLDITAESKENEPQNAPETDDLSKYIARLTEKKVQNQEGFRADGVKVSQKKEYDGLKRKMQFEDKDTSNVLSYLQTFQAQNVMSSLYQL